jgi:hypothetical protein
VAPFRLMVCEVGGGLMGVRVAGPRGDGGSACAWRAWGVPPHQAAGDYGHNPNVLRPVSAGRWRMGCTERRATVVRDGVLAGCGEVGGMKPSVWRLRIMTRRLHGEREPLLWGAA